MFYSPSFQNTHSHEVVSCEAVTTKLSYIDTKSSIIHNSCVISLLNITVPGNPGRISVNLRNLAHKATQLTLVSSVAFVKTGVVCYIS